MLVRISAPSTGVTKARTLKSYLKFGQTTPAAYQQKVSDTSAAFLVGILDSQGTDPAVITHTPIDDEGDRIARDAFSGSYEMWFPLTRTASGEPCEATSGQSFADAILKRMNELHAKGEFLTFEFDPTFGPKSMGEVTFGDRSGLWYQTITIGFSNFGKKLFSVAKPSAVEGL